GLHGEGTRLYLRADLMPHQAAIDEAQGGMGIVIYGQMGIKVWGVPPPHPQDPAAPGLPRVGPPEGGGPSQRPQRQRDASDQAGAQQTATTHTPNRASSWRRCFHRYPPLSNWLPGAADVFPVVQPHMARD